MKDPASKAPDPSKTRNLQKKLREQEKRKRRRQLYAPHVRWALNIEVVQPGARGRRGLDVFLLETHLLDQSCHIHIASLSTLLLVLSNRFTGGLNAPRQEREIGRKESMVVQRRDIALSTRQEFNQAHIRLCPHGNRRGRR